MIVTRFAPSPTGKLHIGNMRAAVFSWLYARQNNGKFILRIDDTDKERSQEEYVDGIKRDLEWLGLDWDQFERQSARMDRYDEQANKLRSIDRLYDCYETPSALELKRKKQLAMGKPPVYDRSAKTLTDAQKAEIQTSPHWRFLLDQEPIIWDDLILDEQRIDAASVSDPVLVRGDGQYLYTLCSVVDDMDMGVTHIVRGADHITNTATQIQMIKVLGGNVPTFAHHSLLTGPQGEGLSKRLGTLALSDFREQGIEPMAILSLVARLGSSEPVELREDMKGIVESFDIKSFGTSSTKFDARDLELLTAKILHDKPFSAVQERLAKMGIEGDQAETFWNIIRANIQTLDDTQKWWRITQLGASVIDADDTDYIETAMKMLPARPWTTQTWSEWTTQLRVETGRKGKTLFMPLRKALTGESHGPDMADFMPLLQKP